MVVVGELRVAQPPDIFVVLGLYATSHTLDRFSVDIYFLSLEKYFNYMEIKCQLDATDDFYCRSYCLFNMFPAPLCPSSGA